MGLLIEDGGLGIHLEVRRESYVIYKDFGEQRIEITEEQFIELERLMRIVKNEKAK